MEDDDDGDYESMEMVPAMPINDAQETVENEDTKPMADDNDEEEEEEEEKEKEEEQTKIVPPVVTASVIPVSAVRRHAGKSIGGKSNMAMKIANRHRKQQHASKSLLDGITKPAIRRLARRSGVKRIAGDVYEGLRKHLDVFMNDVARDAVITMQHKKVTTCTTDILRYVLERSGNTIYGYGH